MARVSRSSDNKVDTAQDRELEHLVERAESGELAAFDELVKRYQRKATGVAYRLLNNRDDALEVVQDAFLKAFDRLDTLSDKARFGAWVLRIVSNLALNRRRRRAIRKAASLDAGAINDNGERSEWVLPDAKNPTPLENATGSDLKGLLREAIEALPEKQRQALVLFSIEKLPQKEVAEILDCSVEAVKWHVFTARKKLKEQLGDFL
jgi:RNA polymerase sigma-70 factor (ECF subfamily)